jgi:hypothetical protein
MSKVGKTLLGKSALRLLHDLAGEGGSARNRSPDAADVTLLISADLVACRDNGALAITATGRSHLARLQPAQDGAQIDPFLRQHLTIAQRTIVGVTGPADVAVDDGESPLVWLARRKGRDGRPLIEPPQLQAGERLRAEFTRAQMMPRVTSNWSAAIADGRRGSAHGVFTETTIAARQHVRKALDAVGPEFSGLLLDVCCFLKRLEDVERERSWPQRSGKVVLQLALDRLARHYGFSAEIRGHAHAAIRTWLAPDTAFVVGD